ncbi:glycoprotein Xg isoform X2 [Saccopteryx leptura]|uniref:glycoprotein Xg isoform X2 n=1 Tax=Saccopteryx leptura TaxID=249018 RepID=UPI00339BBEDB
MAGWRGLLCVTVLCFAIHAQGQGDFDLADALDDPEPTKKPGSDIYPRPKPPAPRPQPGSPDSGNIYPKPKPPYRPQPGYPDSTGESLVFSNRYLPKTEASSPPPTARVPRRWRLLWRRRWWRWRLPAQAQTTCRRRRRWWWWLPARLRRLRKLTRWRQLQHIRRPAWQHGSENRVPHRVRGGGDPGGRGGRLLPAQPEKELLPNQRSGERLRTPLCCPPVTLPTLRPDDSPRGLPPRTLSFMLWP